MSERCERTNVIADEQMNIFYSYELKLFCAIVRTPLDTHPVSARFPPNGYTSFARALPIPCARVSKMRSGPPFTRYESIILNFSYALIRGFVLM